MTVRVVDAQGRPVPDAPVQIEIFNGGSFVPLAILHSDGNGEARWPVGYGSARLSAWGGQGMAEAFLAPADTSATLQLAQFVPEARWQTVCMPMDDLCALDFDLLRSYAAHAVRLREEMSWTAELLRRLPGVCSRISGGLRASCRLPRLFL